MNRITIANKIRNNLNDAGVTYYSLSDIAESIQDGYDEVVVYCECIEKVVNIKQLVNTTYYNMRLLVPDYYRVIRIWSSRINAMLNITSDRENLYYRQDWELANQSSRDVMVLGTEYLGISGRTSDVNTDISFKMWYKATAPIMTNDNDIPRINQKYQILLEHYGTADLLEQNQEFKKAQGYWIQYEKLLNEYRQKIQVLSRSDRVFNREGEYITNSRDLRAYNSSETFN
jgi:hypothetical protein